MTSASKARKKFNRCPLAPTLVTIERERGGTSFRANPSELQLATDILKLKCKRCGAVIQSFTAKNCRGLCMPCYKMPYVVRLANYFMQVKRRLFSRKTDSQAILDLCVLLGHFDGKLLEALEAGSKDPGKANEEYRAVFQSLKDVRPEMFDALPWFILQEYLEKKKQIFFVDWRDDPDDIWKSAREIISPILGDETISPRKGEAQAEKYVLLLNSRLKAKGHQLVNTAPESDTWPLLVVSIEKVQAVVQLGNRSRMARFKAL